MDLELFEKKKERKKKRKKERKSASLEMATISWATATSLDRPCILQGPQLSDSFLPLYI